MMQILWQETTSFTSIRAMFFEKKVHQTKKNTAITTIKQKLKDKNIYMGK